MSASHGIASHGSGKRKGINALGVSGPLTGNHRVTLRGASVAQLAARLVATSRPAEKNSPAGHAKNDFPRKGGGRSRLAPRCAHRSHFPRPAEKSKQKSFATGRGGPPPPSAGRAGVRVANGASGKVGRRP